VLLGQTVLPQWYGFYIDTDSGNTGLTWANFLTAFSVNPNVNELNYGFTVALPELRAVVALVPGIALLALLDRRRRRKE
jgi:hypothetical protein